MTASGLLAVLPPYKGKAVTIVADQDVKDIVNEVCAAHKFFAKDYDAIAGDFWTGNIYDTCQQLFNFCKQNITYEVESDDEQTTKSPAAILTEGHGDCKHYAGFIAGVLDAINRKYDAGIDWNYRFASYDLFNSTPQHVFVVANDNEGDIWIDPVLKKFDARLQPRHKAINKKPMLQRVSGINNELYNYGDYKKPTASVGEFVSIVSDIISFASNIFGKDNVPNYPIKSGNTFEKLKNIVQTNVPGPPTSVEHAKQLLQMAQQALAAEQGGSGSANETIKMMYQEVINALQQYINTGGQIYQPLPGSGGTNPVYVPPSQTAGAFGLSPTVLLLAAGAGVYFLTRKKRVSGKGPGLLPLALGTGAVLLLTKKKPVTTAEAIKAPETTEATQAQPVNYLAQLDANPDPFTNPDSYIDMLHEQYF